MIAISPQTAAILAVGDLSSVQASLQTALQLEHATIPLYLYAYYSLEPARNALTRQIIHSVLVEEMLHLALVSNVLNAINGTPRLGGSDTPRYSGSLPGGVASQLQVRLAPCSLHQIELIFLAIEEPEKALTPFPVNELRTKAQLQVTIGQFYRGIQSALQALPSRIFAPTPRNQLGSDLFDGLTAVTDLPSALAAIDIIVDQGEGTSTSPSAPDEPDSPKAAHWYRFNQIVQGGLLQQDPSGKYAYDRAAAPVDFDPTAVANVPTSPHAGNYPIGSPERAKVDDFNRLYTRMLDTLSHGLATGSKQTLQQAINTMTDELGPAAESMMWPTDGSKPIGPTFELNTTSAGQDSSAGH